MATPVAELPVPKFFASNPLGAPNPPLYLGTTSFTLLQTSAGAYVSVVLSPP